jgi:hypothetical protein
MNENLILKEDTIINRIYMIRGMRVMLDRDVQRGNETFKKTSKAEHGPISR